MSRRRECWPNKQPYTLDFASVGRSVRSVAFNETLEWHFEWYSSVLNNDNGGDGVFVPNSPAQALEFGFFLLLFGGKFSTVGQPESHKHGGPQT